MQFNFHAILDGCDVAKLKKIYYFINLTCLKFNTLEYVKLMIMQPLEKIYHF